MYNYTCLSIWFLGDSILPQQSPVFQSGVDFCRHLDHMTIDIHSSWKRMTENS